MRKERGVEKIPTFAPTCDRQQTGGYGEARKLVESISFLVAFVQTAAKRPAELVFQTRQI